LDDFGPEGGVASARRLCQTQRRVHDAPRRLLVRRRALGKRALRRGDGAGEGRKDTLVEREKGFDGAARRRDRRSVRLVKAVAASKSAPRRDDCVDELGGGVAVAQQARRRLLEERGDQRLDEPGEFR